MVISECANYDNPATLLTIQSKLLIPFSCGKVKSSDQLHMYQSHKKILRAEA